MDRNDLVTGCHKTENKIMEYLHVAILAVFYGPILVPFINICYDFQIYAYIFVVVLVIIRQGDIQRENSH